MKEVKFETLEKDGWQIVDRLCAGAFLVRRKKS